jgi:hypothetical protein
MKRTGFARKVYSTPHAPVAPIPREMSERISYGVARMSVSVPKVKSARSEEYRRLVAALPCDLCGARGRSQAAHPNCGKGMAMKTDDRLCFPLCIAFHGSGCHELFDQGALMTKERRREYEPEAGKRTRDTINAMGLWPKRLPQWSEDA